MSVNMEDVLGCIIAGRVWDRIRSLENLISMLKQEVILESEVSREVGLA